MNRTRRALAVTLAFVVAGCGDDSTAPTNNASLNFLEPAPTAPALGTQTITFNAVQGQDTEVFLWYRRRPERADSSKLLRFRIDRDAQIVRPNGTALTAGQSTPITITVVDPVRLIVDFQPSGLRFNGGQVADLTMWYIEQDHDFNDDGVINATDVIIEQTLAIWRRESAQAPWVRLSGAIQFESDEIEVEITGFTNYVIAY